MKGRKLLITVLAVLCGACSTQHKADRLRGMRATLSLPDDTAVPEMDISGLRRDTMTVTDSDGKEILIMRAVKDIDGEMVATDVLSAARVTARFRNVAERQGRVDLRFDVTVPREMQDSRWQLRFQPVMSLLDEQVPLDPVIITGEAYRKAQLRGYQQYQRFLDSIISDSTLLISARQLEIFIRRNIPQLYRFRTDTTFVTDETFASVYGVTERQAIEHYSLRFKIRRNERRISRKGKMFDKYVKAPILTDGLRLDTVLTDANRDFVYSYVQTVYARPRLRKVDITLSGEIFEQDKLIFRIPKSDSLTFYISSLSSLADNTERYLFQVVERTAAAHTACYIDFASGSAELNPALGDNASETARIRSNLRDLLASDIFEMDSVVVTASSSPEGSLATNERLSRRRADVVSAYFQNALHALEDSIRRSEGIVMGLDETGGREQSAPIPFIARNNPENWPMLDALVTHDSLLTKTDKASYFAMRKIPDADRREAGLRTESYYAYLRGQLYPRLRTVRFDFHLHRKGMLQDTLHTTVPDTVYRDGVQAIRDRDYEKAVTLLRPYQDYNTAVAYLCMGYNASSMDILQRMEQTPPVHYMLAILHARQGDDRNAVQCYLRACEQDAAYVHRGNLDPEIAELIRRYDLNRKPEEEITLP